MPTLEAHEVADRLLDIGQRATLEGGNLYKGQGVYTCRSRSGCVCRLMQISHLAIEVMVLWWCRSRYLALQDAGLQDSAQPQFACEVRLLSEPWAASIRTLYASHL